MQGVSNMKDKFNDIKEIGKHVQKQWPGEKKQDRQAPEQMNHVDYQNMAQLLNKIHALTEESACTRRVTEESAKQIHEKWIDLRRMVMDVDAKLNVLIEAVSKIPATAEVNKVIEGEIEKIKKRSMKKGLANAVMAVMADNKERHVHQVCQELKIIDEEGWPEMSVYSTLSLLANQYKLKKIRKGIYVLANPVEAPRVE